MTLDIRRILVPIDFSANSGRALDYGQWREGWHVLLETGQPGARLEGLIGNFQVLSGWNLTSIDADWRDIDANGTVDTVYAVGVGDPVVPDGQGTRVILSHGDPTGVLTEIVLDFSDPARPALTPVGAGVHADDNRLFIGVSGDDPTFVDNDGDGQADPVDAVGWVFFGWP